MIKIYKLKNNIVEVISWEQMLAEVKCSEDKIKKLFHDNSKVASEDAFYFMSKYACKKFQR